MESAHRYFRIGAPLILEWTHQSTGICNRTASFFAGMVLQFMNPKIYVYAITAMSLYILPVFHTKLALVVFTFILTVIGASGSYVWALFGSAFCRFFARHTKAVNLVMALLLVFCAVSLFS